nr:MAG TPA: hypothetical protein [Caudoviricetes sp.]
MQYTYLLTKGRQRRNYLHRTQVYLNGEMGFLHVKPL